MKLHVVTMGILDPLYNLFGWVCSLLYDWIGNYGVVVILFTILLKVVMLPIGLKSSSSTMRMQSLSSEVNEIKRHYPKDMQKQQQLIGEMYKKNGVSQTAGCLTSILQLLVIWPVFAIIRGPLHYIGRVTAENIQNIAQHLFQNGHITEGVLRGSGSMDIPLVSALEAHGAALSESINQGWLNVSQLVNMNFLGLDLGLTPTWRPDILFGAETRGTYLPLLILPALTLITQFLSMRASQMMMLNRPLSKEEKRRERNNPAKAGQTQTDPSAGMMRSMTYVMPVIMLFTIFTMPAAMGIYWIMSSLMMLMQTLLSYHLYIKPYKMAREAAQSGTKPAQVTEVGVDKPGFFERFRKKPE